jgi:hypothetical protein
MKSRATGVGVRFFKVTIPTGAWAMGNLTGNTLSSGRLEINGMVADGKFTFSSDLNVGDAPWSFVRRNAIQRMGPELTDLGAAPSRIEDWHWGLVAKEQRRGVDGSQLDGLLRMQSIRRSELAQRGLRPVLLQW